MTDIANNTLATRLSAIGPFSAAPRAEAALLAGNVARSESAGAAPNDAALKKAAIEFESVFLSEMLKHAKLTEAKGPFSGGSSEETYRMLLTREYADRLAESESFGLAEHIYRELKQKAAINAV